MQDQALESSHQAREKEWSQYLNDFQNKCEKIDDAYNQKEKDLRLHFQKLETLGTIEVHRGNLSKAVNSYEKAFRLANTELEIRHLFGKRCSYSPNYSFNKTWYGFA